VQQVPPALPAAIFIVQHIGTTSVLPEVLQRCQPQASIVIPKDNEAISAGRIYVAVPNLHLVIEDGNIRRVWDVHDQG
jgi:two-component system chemotaxis response regulator CheB